MSEAMVRLATSHPALDGLRVLVVGLGKSGIAAARLATRCGARVTATDRRPAEDLATELRALAGTDAAVVAGGHPSQLAQDADLVIVSPGVPPESPLLEAARDRGVPVWAEVELAFRFCRGRIVGITGSNGKSTVTSMIGTILRRAGLTGGTGGNLGTPFTELLAEDGDDAVHAVELSSFQLECVEAFRADVAVIVNLSPDHLDRHPTFEHYARAKARILERQRPADLAVLNDDDRPSDRFVPLVRGELQRVSTRHEVEAGGFVRDGMLVLRAGAREHVLMPAAELPVPGEHNVGNALAAAVACLHVGCEPQAIASGLRGFEALPHRLQRVARIGGVDWYDDSKATNLDATARALGSFAPGTVLLLLGGKDKGADWASLVPLARERARQVLLVGQAAPAIRRALEGHVPLRDCGTVRAAVAAARELARTGDVVLLAPGCASFDQYRNFMERGEDFRRAVLGDGRA